MTASPAASFRTILGVGLESTYGTAVPPADFIPVNAPKNVTKPTFIGDTAWRGSMIKSYDTVLGVTHGELDWDGPVYVDTFGFLLASLLPDVVTTGSSAPYTHTFSALNSGNAQPKGITVTDFDGVQTLAYPGTKISELGIKFTADQLLTASVKGMSLAPATASAMTPSYSTVAAFAGWTPTISINSVARSTGSIVLDAEVDIKRTVEVVPGVTGSNTPALIWSGMLEVSGKLTVIQEDTVDYGYMTGNTQPPMSITFTRGSAGTTQAITLQMSKAAYTAAETDRGKDYVTMAISFDAKGNTTDVGASGGYSDIKVTLENAIAAGTYQ